MSLLGFPHLLHRRLADELQTARVGQVPHGAQEVVDGFEGDVNTSGSPPVEYGNIAKVKTLQVTVELRSIIHLS